MPVLTAFPPQPIHSGGWTSMHPEAPFLSRTSSRLGSVVSRASPLVRMHSRQKRCKSQLEKMNKSTVVPLQPSNKKNKLRKRSAAIENLTHVEVTSSVPVIKGILTKPSSLLNLYQSDSPVTGSEIETVAGSTSVWCPAVSTSNYKSVVKKVRFSISRPDNSVLQSELSALHSKPVASSASNESDLLYHDYHLEPVTETIFFTHSRYSYDRSPIAVDKVLNKSLDLPPRTPIDALSAGRWLPKSRPINHYGDRGVPINLALCNQPIHCVPSESTDINHSSSLAHSQIEGPECCGPGSVHHTCDYEDGSNELNAPKCCTIFNFTDGSPGKNKSLDVYYTENSTLPRNLGIQGDLKHDQFRKFNNNPSIIEDNLTCHSFSNLKIEETLDGSTSEACILEVDDIFGIGNWTRAQVFGSCDALDGF